MKDKSVLNSFNNLRQGSQKLQIKSGIDVLQHLWTQQKNYKLEEPCNELKLGLRRIIRGLGAPTSNSRKGFFLTYVGLCELFSSPTITVQMCNDVIEKELRDFASKVEENNMYKGQMLAYGGLIHSAKISQANSEEKQHMYQQLQLLSGKKSYLALSAHTLLVNWITQMDEDEFKESLWPILSNEMLTNNDKTLQWYNLLFVLSKKFPRLINEGFLNRVIGHPNIFHKVSSQLIADVILTTPQAAVYIDVPAYEEMFSELINNETTFTTIWSMIDKKLASTTTTSVDFIYKFFVCCLQKLEDKNSIKKVFEPNFVNLLISKSDDNSMENVRLHAISKLCEMVSKKDFLTTKTQKLMVKKLFFYPGNLQFLQDSGFKVFQSLTIGFDENTVKSILQLFTDVLNEGSMMVVSKGADKEVVNKPWKDLYKRKACKIIISLLQHPTVINCIDWKLEQIKCIIDIAFFSKVASPKLCEDARRGFYSVLDFKFAKLSDLCSFLNGIVVYMDGKIKSDEYTSVEFSKEMKNAWKKMLKTVTSNSSSDSDDRKLMDTVFNVMFLMLGLTLINDPTVAINNLSELHAIHTRMCSEFANSKVNSTSDDEDLHWTDVVVDLILSMLSYNSHLLRNVISNVFIFLCPHLSTHNIHQILTVLNPNEASVLSSDTEGPHVETNGESKFNELKSSDEDDGGSSDSESSDNSEESDLDEDVDEEDTDYDKLRARVREALGDAGGVTDTESIDLDDLDEEEGKKLDESLSAVFKEMKQQKSKSRSAEHIQLSDFRTRVLDLLEVWTKTNPELNVIFDVMVTALLLLESSLQNEADLQLQKKLQSFLKQLTTVKQFTTNEKVDVKQVIQLVKKLMDREDKTAAIYKNMSPQITNCCTFILKVSLRDFKRAKKMRPLIEEAYRSALNILLNKTNSIMPISLFKSAFTLPWEGLFNLIEDVLGCLLKPDTKLFCFSQALDLLQIFLQNKRLLTSDICNTYNSRIQEIALGLVKIAKNLEGKPNKLCFQFVQICQSFKKLGVASDIVDTINFDSLRKCQSNNIKRKLESETPINSSKKKQKSNNNLDEGTDDKVNGNVENGSERLQKRKRDKHTNALKLRKKSKFVRSEELSKGVESEIFGRHLFNNSAFMLGEVQNEDVTL